MLPSLGLADPVGLVFLPDEIEALVALGELARAQPLVELLRRLGEAHDRPWAIAAAARSRGILATAQGELDVATAAFDEALAAHERVEMPFERARTLLALGRARRRRKQWSAAELAASGLSNQEVAERAFLTVKGVEANLTRAYRKLGIRSRGGLAAALPRDDEPVT
jgi:DNA-binding NarL/FixJ family response regulator